MSNGHGGLPSGEYRQTHLRHSDESCHGQMGLEGPIEPAPIREARLAAIEIFDGVSHQVAQFQTAPIGRELVSYDDL